MAQNNITNGSLTSMPNNGTIPNNWYTSNTQIYRTGEIRISHITGDYEMFDGARWVVVTNTGKDTHTQYKLKQVLAWLNEHHPEIIFDLLMRDTICEDDLPKNARSKSSSDK